MQVCDKKLRMFTSLHSQTDGTAEIMNRILKNFFCCYCLLNQDNWVPFLPSTELPFNSSRLNSTGYTSFELDLGWNSASTLDLFRTKPSSAIQSVETLRSTLKSSLIDAKFSHELVQARQSPYNCKKSRPYSYKQGDSMWLDKIHFTDVVYRSQSLRKLGAKWLDSFKIVELFEKNGIRIELSSNIRTHDMLHVKHTEKLVSQSPYIAAERPKAAHLNSNDKGEHIIKIGKVQAYNKKWKTYYL